MSLCYWNGRILPADEVAVSPFDRGLTLGDGVFETIRAYNGRIFRLPEHLDRLYHSADVLGLDLPPDLDAAVQSALAANGWADAVLRLTVTRGATAPTKGGILPDPDLAPSVLITGRDLAGHPPYPERYYRDGISMAICGPARDETSPLSGCKTLNYLPQILLRQEAARRGADDGLQLNSSGAIVGASVSNLFGVIDGILLTPPLTAGCLPGITRAALLELAWAAGIPTEERAFGVPELAYASEVFLANTLLEVAPVASVGDWRSPQVPGPITAQLAAAFQQLTTN